MGCFGCTRSKKLPGLFDTINVNSDTRGASGDVPKAFGPSQIIRGSMAKGSQPQLQTSAAATAVYQQLHQPIPPKATTAIARKSTETMPTKQNVPRKPIQNQGGQETKAKDDPFEFLGWIETLFLIDDSAAMKPYWGEVMALVRRVVPLCVERDTSGIDIYFGNHRPAGSMFGGIRKAGYRHIGLVSGMADMHDNVAGIFNDVKPTGSHRVTTRLLELLDEYMRRYRERIAATGSTTSQRPINIIVVTGQPLSRRIPEGVEGIARQLDELKAPSQQLGIQFFRVGDDEQTRKEMELLDDTLHAKKGVRDIIDTATWTDGPGKLSADGVMKVVAGAVSRTIDKLKLEEVRMPEMPENAW